MLYKDVKNAILKDGGYLRESDDELLKRWFWAGVAAAVQVIPVKNTLSNSDYVEAKTCANCAKLYQCADVRKHPEWHCEKHDFA